MISDTVHAAKALGKYTEAWRHPEIICDTKAPHDLNELGAARINLCDRRREMTTAGIEHRGGARYTSTLQYIYTKCESGHEDNARARELPRAGIPRGRTGPARRAHVEESTVKEDGR